MYVHFPFCLSKCPYCDFASIAAQVVPEERYTRALLRELELRLAAHGLRGHPVESIFVGGGTPSLWAPERLGQVLDALARGLALEPGLEVSLEANPGAADAQRFQGYRAAGVTRLSMGVQSLQARTLAALGRAHDAATALKAFGTARAAGFDNLSLDFIYGVHGQTLEEVRADAAAAAGLGAEHLSAYALTLDKASLAEEVPLAKQLARGEVALPPDDTVVAMQRAVRDAWGGVGLVRYEVSNYAQPGRHSRHNALYWTGGRYLALGAGATGFVDDAAGPVRYANHRSAEKYLAQVEAGRLPEASRETLTNTELFTERLALGLRLTCGVDLEAVCRAFGEEPGPRLTTVRHLVSGGLAVQEGGRLRLTDQGFDLHSAIAARLM